MTPEFMFVSKLSDWPIRNETQLYFNYHDLEVQQNRYWKLIYRAGRKKINNYKCLYSADLAKTLGGGAVNVNIYSN